ncbi:hypothetical protein [Flavobacterium sp. RS13.1]|jgi:large-conductance mechanosensitive channel|uniref:hypothetical protein n=1 Tax=Flavobacterium sp. RS13.1 TaxID=3400345 RepID=UPI003AABB7FE
MDNINEFYPSIVGLIFLILVWFVIRRILSSISDKVNNSEAYKEDTLRVLEEIRDELRELNKNNSSK